MIVGDQALFSGTLTLFSRADFSSGCISWWFRGMLSKCFSIPVSVAKCAPTATGTTVAFPFHILSSFRSCYFVIFSVYLSFMLVSNGTAISIMIRFCSSLTRTTMSGIMAGMTLVSKSQTISSSFVFGITYG
jgi:hypothetical protein